MDVMDGSILCYDEQRNNRDMQRLFVEATPYNLREVSSGGIPYFEF